MRYQINGDSLPAVTISLDRGESIFTQSGGMSWMTDKIQMETNMKGGIMRSLGRMFTGESLFMANYTAQADAQEITLSSSFPGSIVALQIGKGIEYVIQKSAFLCATPNVTLKMEVVKGLSGGIFGGEGFLLQRLSGEGVAFVEIDGYAVEKDLMPGEKLKVDTGNVAIYQSSVQYSAEMVKGFKNVLFGGEGLFLTSLQGPGKIYLQTISLPNFAARIIPFLPTSNNN